MNFTNSHNNETFYSLLNVQANASQEEIKKAYRKLSLELHPDKNKSDPEKLEKFKKITSAYNILSNPDERAMYDSSLTFNNLNLPDGIFMNMLFNPIDINSVLNDLKKTGFNPVNQNKIPIDLFSKFSMNQNFMQGVNSYEFDSKPKTIFQTISISLLDAYKGCKLPINIKRWVYENNIQFDQEETIYIDIPKGVDNNEIITVKDKGNKISSSNKGDIEIKIIINNDTLFERNGIDLIYKKTITLKQSLCGFSFDIKYIDGREFRINNESGNIIPNDFRKTISQFGMQRDSHIGDLIIIFEVEFPKSLKLEQIDKLNAIL
jgi:DnaJ-class molecular chaperone